MKIPDFSIFVTMTIITFFHHVDQNYSVFLIRMDVLVDLVGPGQNVTVHVQRSDMVRAVLWNVIVKSKTVMMSLVFAFKADVLPVGLVKIVKLNVRKESGVQNAKMIVEIVLMEHHVIELVRFNM